MKKYGVVVHTITTLIERELNLLCIPIDNQTLVALYLPLHGRPGFQS